MPTLTLTFGPAAASRIANAIGSRQGLGRPATGQEVEAAVAQMIKRLVVETEQSFAVTAALQGVTDTDLDIT